MFFFHETRAKKKPKERKKETKIRNQKKAKRKTRRKEERKEKERDRERKREKGGGQKRLWRKKGRHSKINKKRPLLGGKRVFY